MATISGTIDKTVTVDNSVFVISWSGLAASGDVGDAQSLASYSDKTFVVSGAFTGAPTIVIEGSNDGINWLPLSNRQGTAMSFTATGMNTSQDRPVYVRPRVSAGAGGASVLVTVACHRTDLPGNGG